MNLEAFLSQALEFVGSYNLQIAVLLSLICILGEGVGFSIPYLLETVWMLSGYQMSRGVLPFSHLVLMVLTAQGGRQTGAFFLYNFSRSGSNVLLKVLRFFKFDKYLNKGVPSEVTKRINLLSPFSVALGRLLWLRIPLTLVLGAKKKHRILASGVAIQSLIWDSTYVVVGAVVGTAALLKPGYLMLFFLSGLAVMYLVTFAVRRLYGSLSRIG